MATSGTVAFRPDVEEIISEAYERCGIDPQTRTGDQAVSARRSLNLLFSEWANRGINYWTVSKNTLTLVKDQTTPYTLPEGTIDIIDAVVSDSSGTDTSDQIIIVFQLPITTSYQIKPVAVNQVSICLTSNTRQKFIFGKYLTCLLTA